METNNTIGGTNAQVKRDNSEGERRRAHPIKHFRVITKHRHTVMKHCFRAGIPIRGLLHDLSKYSPTEFLPGAKFFDGSRSPTELERAAHGYSRAWVHHKGRNRHHFEYWTDYHPVTKQMVPVKMPLKFVIEMFCDRVAACKVYKGREYDCASPYEYFARGSAKKRMHEDTGALLERLLVMLRDEGEDKTFAYIRRDLRGKKDY